jgi:hypothetical protein
MSTVGPIKTEVPEKAEVEPEIPSAGGYESEPKVMQSKRMSVGRPGPPGIVRTFSTRSSSLRSAQQTPVASPKLVQQPEPRSYLDDNETTDDEQEPQAIGIARTSDIPIRSTPTPDMAARGGYVEAQPRQTSISSISNRNTPSPDAKPIVPERSVARKEPHSRELSGGAIAAAGGAFVAAGASQLGNITSAPRQQASSKSHGASLPALQEVDGQANVGRHRTASEASPARRAAAPVRETRANTIGSQKSSEDTKRLQRVPTEGSPSSEKSAVQRMPSTSSKKSGSFSGKQSGRDSEASQRPSVRGRMSEEDRERQFESLVNGEETVKFTLTPQTVRDFEVSSPSLSLN